VLVAGGAIGGIAAASSGESETTTVTATITTTVQTPPPGVPAAVEETRAAIQAAAEARDFERLAGLVSPDGFEYTFGGPVEGGPAAYWRQLEQKTPERPLETLAEILRMPYTLSFGHYVWPFAYDKEPRELTAYERELLAPIADAETIQGWIRFGGYLGWRAGIEPDGDWVFYVAGD
jgi:hypothetical protein